MISQSQTFPVGQSPEAADRHAIKKKKRPGLGKVGDSDKRKIKQMGAVARCEDEVREEAPVSG